MSVIKMRIAMVGAIILTSSFASQAQQTDWKNFVSSVHDGYVMQFSHPPDWVENDNMPTSFNLSKGGLVTDIPGIFAKATIRIDWGSVDWDATSDVLRYPLPDTIAIDEIPPSVLAAIQSGDVSSTQLDKIIKVNGGCGWLRECIEFVREAVRLSGSDGILIQYSRPEVFDFPSNGLTVPTEANELSSYFAAYESNVALQIHLHIDLEIGHLWPADGNVTDPFVRNLFKYKYLNTALGPAYREVLPEFLEMLKAAKFLTPSELDPALEVTTIYESERVQISRRRDYTASGKFWISVPGDWDIKEIEILQADPNYETGNMTVQFTAPAEKSTVGYSEALYVNLRGMPVRSLVPEEFLATADDWAKIFSAEYQLLDSRMIDLNGMGFAKLRSTFITGTGDTQVNTYSGVDTDGKPIKYTIYTAGGQTMVANIIFLADEADHDKLLPEIEDMLSSLSVDFFSPGAFQ